MWHRPTYGKGQTQRHTPKKLLALLTHSFWGVHIGDRNQSFTSWGVNIAGRNWAFSCAVEKLSRHCPGTEYQHKLWHTSSILCGIHKNYRHQCCIKICQDIILQQGEQRRPQMAPQTLGYFHINPQFLQAISHNHNFNRNLSKKLSNNSALHRLSSSNHQGRSIRLSSMYWQSSNLLRSFGTSPISLTLLLYTECNPQMISASKNTCLHDQIHVASILQSWRMPWDLWSTIEHLASLTLDVRDYGHATPPPCYHTPQWVYHDPARCAQ
jgi:hypothetical protein